MLDLLVGDDDTVPELTFGSYSHQVIIFHDGATKVDHVDEAAGHASAPKSGGVEKAGAADHQNSPIVAFFTPFFWEFDLGKVGGEIKILHSNLI